ncbi:MAG: hypothetical protein JWN37_798 [Candidatus Nomurabacteria bacterium]|nr:hypothetical protein [Candidatus Nomurabacteria bacterium]
MTTNIPAPSGAFVGSIDRSGSRAGEEKAMVLAWNAFMANMKKDPLGQNMRGRISMWDNMGTDILRQGVFSEIKPLTNGEIEARALTPLYDNVMFAIQILDEMEGARKALVIDTDGLENYSQKWKDVAPVRAEIEKRREQGWLVIYLAKNIDAWKVAEELGIPKENAMNYRNTGAAAPHSGGLLSRFRNHVAEHPMGYALGATAALVGAYMLLRPGQSHGALGFTDSDRNNAMGVDGVSQTWQNAVADDASGFREPINHFMDLPTNLQEAYVGLPEDFDPLLGSMNEDGTQPGLLDPNEDVLDATDAESLANGEYAEAGQGESNATEDTPRQGNVSGNDREEQGADADPDPLPEESNDSVSIDADYGGGGGGGDIGGD